MTEAIFTPEEKGSNHEDEKLERYFCLLPERMENETDEEYVEKVVDVERSIERKPAYTKQEVILKDAVRMYLYHEMKFDDKKMGELLRVERVTINSWRHKHRLELNSSRKPNKRKASSGCNYYRSEKSKESIASAVLLLMAMRHGRRGDNISVNRVRRFVNQSEL